MTEKEAWADISRWQQRVDFEEMKRRGFKGVVARCTIGWSYVDPWYDDYYFGARDAGLTFGAYGVNWPINRDPVKEARWMINHLIPPGGDELPKIVVGDFELGTRKHKYNHHLVSGEDLYDQARRFMLTLRQESGVSRQALYTASWHWNDPKMPDPDPNGWELDYDLWEAYYHWRTMYSDVLFPEEVPLGLEYPPITKPWSKEDLFAWQWTSKVSSGSMTQSGSMDRNVVYKPISSTPPEPPEPTPDDPARLRELAGEIVVIADRYPSGG